MATHSRILVWRIPWAEERDRLQSMRLQRVGDYRLTENAHTQSGFENKCLRTIPLGFSFFCKLEMMIVSASENC